MSLRPPLPLPGAIDWPIFADQLRTVANHLANVVVLDVDGDKAPADLADKLRSMAHGIDVAYRRQQEERSADPSDRPDDRHAGPATPPVRAHVVEWDVFDDTGPHGDGVLGALIVGDDGEIIHRPYQRPMAIHDGPVVWSEAARDWVLCDDDEVPRENTVQVVEVDPIDGDDRRRFNVVGPSGSRVFSALVADTVRAYGWEVPDPAVYVRSKVTEHIAAGFADDEVTFEVTLTADEADATLDQLAAVGQRTGKVWEGARKIRDAIMAANDR